MCLGGGGGGAPKRTADQKRQDRLIVEAMKIRQAFLPLLTQQFGYQYTPPASGDIDDPGSMTALPKTPLQAGLDSLALSGIGLANQGSQAMQSRMDMAQGLLPGLMRSVQASVVPGKRAPFTPAFSRPWTASSPQQSPGLPTAPPSALVISSTPPASDSQALMEQIFRLLSQRLPGGSEIG